MTLGPGSRLGPYEVLSPLGAGGMGEVWKARDPRLGRDVAIKVLPVSFSADPDRLRRFEQEAQAAGALNHPNITAVYDIGQNDGAPYVVQELLEGETLRMELSGGRFSPRKVIDCAVQITHGLAAAHEKGIVHRDLKPENLFVTKGGRVKILDFGLAKLTAPGAARLSSATALPTRAPDLTAEGKILGTFQYMAPEQLEGKEADARTDIFAFGGVLYEIATGRTGTSQASVITAIMSSEPATISSIQPTTPPALGRVVRTCLAKDPEERWQSAADIARELRWVAEGGAADEQFSAGRRLPSL